VSVLSSLEKLRVTLPAEFLAAVLCQHEGNRCVHVLDTSKIRHFSSCLIITIITSLDCGRLSVVVFRVWLMI